MANYTLTAEIVPSLSKTALLGIGKGIKGSGIGLALTGLAAGASQVGTAIASMSAAAVPALAVLPGLALAGAAAMATVKVATAGLGKAISAGFNPAAKAATDNSGAMARALDGVKTAQMGLADAQRTAKTAQASLAGAYDAARQSLENLRASIKGNALDQRQSALDVKKAKQDLDKTLADPKATQDQREEADITYQRALLQQKSIADDAKRLAKEKKAADKAGLSGSKEVVSAQEQIRAANEQVIKSQQALTAAYRAQATAAKGSGAAGVDAMAGLPPALRAVAKEVIALKGMFDKLRAATSSALFAGITDQIKPLVTTYFPALKTLMVGIASGFGKAGAEIIGFLRNSKTVATVSQLFKDLRAVVDNVVAGLPNIVKGLLPLVSVGTSFLPGLTKGFSDITVKFAEFMQQASKSGALKDFITGGLSALKQLGGLLASVGSILTSVFAGAGEKGKTFFGVIADIVKQFADFLKTAEGAKAIQAILGAIGAVGKALGTALGAVLPVLATALVALAPAITPLANAFSAMIQSIAPILPAIGQLVGLLAGGLSQALLLLAPYVDLLLQALGPVFINILKTLIPALLPLIQVLGGALLTIVKALAPIIGLIVKVIAALLPVITPLIPPIADFVGKLIELLAQALQPLLPVIQLLFTALGQILTALLPLLPVLLQLFQALMPLFPPIANLAAQLIKFLLPAVVFIINILVKLVGYIVKILMPVIKFLVKVINDMVNSIVPLLQKLWDNAVRIFNGIKGTVTGVWDKIKTATTTVFDAVKGTITTVLDKIKTAFSTTIGAIKTIWDKLKDIAKVPVNFMIETVYNKGIVPLWNNIVSKIPGVGDIKTMPAFASGGKIPGDSGMRFQDDRLASSPYGPIALAGGEYIMNARSTQKYLPQLEAMNSAHNGDGGFAHGGIPGFGIGGFIGDVGGAVTGVLKKAGKVVRGALGTVLEKGLSPIRDTINGIPGTEKGLGNVLKQIPLTALSKLSDFVRGDDAAQQVAAGSASGYYNGVSLNAYKTAKGLKADNKVMLALLEAGIVESGMVNLDHGADDSLGFLQQRPSQGWKDPMNVVTATTSFVKAAQKIEAGFNSSGLLAQGVQKSAYPKKYGQQEGAATALLAALAGGGGTPGVGTGMGYKAQEAVLKKAGFNLRFAPSQENKGTHVDGSYHYQDGGRAIDIGVGTNGQKTVEKVWDFLVANYAKSSKELFWAQKSVNYRNGQPTGPHDLKNHIHWAMAQGGKVPGGVFDNGGWLKPGQTGMNMGKAPEAVLTPKESAGLKKGLVGSGGGVTYYGGDTVVSFGDIHSDVDMQMALDRIDRLGGAGF